MLGTGAGTFQAATNYGIAGSTPVWITIGDFDGDGKPDLAVATYANISVLRGNGAHESSRPHPSAGLVGSESGESLDIPRASRDRNTVVGADARG